MDVHNELISDLVYPSYVHTILPNVADNQWPIQAQGYNECTCTAPANALNLLHYGHSERFYDKNAFVAAAGVFQQGKLGGAPSFVTSMLIQRHGGGSHFGNLRQTNAEIVLRGLIDQGIPVCVEIDQNTWGPFKIYGLHAIVLVGYSDLYRDHDENEHEEYYFVDSAYGVKDGTFGAQSNNVDRDGDGIVERYPGNRTMPRTEFLSRFPTGIYFPVFPSQSDHDRWYAHTFKHLFQFPIVGWLRDQFITGTFDTL